jgi:hypothetical protein
MPPPEACGPGRGADVYLLTQSLTPHTHKHTHARTHARTHTHTHTHTHNHSLLPPLCAYVLARARARVGALQAQGRQAAPYRRARARARPSRPPTQSLHSHLPPTHCARRTRPNAHLLPCPLLSSLCALLCLTERGPLVRACTWPEKSHRFLYFDVLILYFSGTKYQGRISR